jgi:hypothetical protein
MENLRNFLDVRQFLNSIERPVIGNIKRELARYNLKVNVVVSAEYVRGEQREQINFRTRNEIITSYQLCRILRGCNTRHIKQDGKFRNPRKPMGPKQDSKT